MKIQVIGSVAQGSRLRADSAVLPRRGVFDVVAVGGYKGFPPAQPQHRLANLPEVVSGDDLVEAGLNSWKEQAEGLLVFLLLPNPLLVGLDPDLGSQNLPLRVHGHFEFLGLLGVLVGTVPELLLRGHDQDLVPLLLFYLQPLLPLSDGKGQVFENQLGGVNKVVLPVRTFGVEEVCGGEPDVVLKVEVHGNLGVEIAEVVGLPPGQPVLAIPSHQPIHGLPRKHEVAFCAVDRLDGVACRPYFVPEILQLGEEGVVFELPAVYEEVGVRKHEAVPVYVRLFLPSKQARLNSSLLVDLFWPLLLKNEYISLRRTDSLPFRLRISPPSEQSSSRGSPFEKKQTSGMLTPRRFLERGDFFKCRRTKAYQLVREMPRLEVRSGRGLGGGCRGGGKGILKAQSSFQSSRCSLQGETWRLALIACIRIIADGYNRYHQCTYQRAYTCGCSSLPSSSSSTPLTSSSGPSPSRADNTSPSSSPTRSTSNSTPSTATTRTSLLSSSPGSTWSKSASSSSPSSSPSALQEPSNSRAPSSPSLSAPSPSGKLSSTSGTPTPSSQPKPRLSRWTRSNSSTSPPPSGWCAPSGPSGAYPPASLAPSPRKRRRDSYPHHIEYTVLGWCPAETAALIVRYKLMEQNQSSYGNPQWLNVQPPSQNCASGNPVSQVCSNPICKSPAIFCDQPRCSCFKQHQQCQKASLSDVTTLLQERSASVKAIVQRMDSLEARFADEARNRKHQYIQQSFYSGFEPRQVEAIETIYFGKQGVDLKGYHTDDIDVAIREDNKLRTMSEQEQNFQRFEEELRRIYGQLDRLELSFLEGQIEDPRAQGRSLEVTKYGYYDITTSMAQVPKNERRTLTHLILNNTSTLHSTQGGTLPLTQQFPFTYTAYQAIDSDVDIRERRVEMTSFSRIKFLRQGVATKSTQIVKQQPLRVQGKQCSKGRNGTDAARKEQFTIALSKFTRLKCLTIKVLHNFNKWNCFDQLADLINLRLTRLQRLELSVKQGEEDVEWVKNLRPGIEVLINPMTDRSVFNLRNKA